MTAGTALVEGFAKGSFGRVRHFGTASWTYRPVAFVASAATYCAAVVLLGRCAAALLSRMRGRT